MQKKVDIGASALFALKNKHTQNRKNLKLA